MKTMSRMVLAATARTLAVVSVGSAVALAPGASLAADKDKDKGKAAQNSPEFAKAAAPLQKTLADAQPLIKKYQDATDQPSKDQAMAALKAGFADAPAQLAAAEAAIKTPQDKLLAGKWGVNVGAVVGDTKILQRAYQNVIDSGVADPAELPNDEVRLGNVAYSNGDFQTAIKALTPLLSSATVDDTTPEMVAAAYAGAGQPDQALAALKSAIDARVAANAPVPDNWLNRGTQITYKLKDSNPALGTMWALETVAVKPTPLNWLGAAQLIRIYNKYGGQESLDISRLLLRAGALTADKQAARGEFLEMIQSADARRFPGEVLAVIDTGVKAGAISPTDQFVSEAKGIAAAHVAADRASLPALERDARAPSASLATTMAAADAFLSYGEAAKAVSLYQIALTKPGVDMPKALTRLGIAQVDTGDYAGAQASFAKVTGSRKPIADFWALYAKSKAAGK